MEIFTAVNHKLHGLPSKKNHSGREHLHQLADTLEATAADPALTTSAQRFIAVAHAYRQWALAHPIDFQLLYGNPIPNYTQPTDVTYPQARRSNPRFTSLLTIPAQ